MATTEPLRILCVEDDKATARLLQRRLNQAGYQTDVAYNGDDAFRMWSSGSYEVLTVDHDIQEKTGIELIRDLASLGPLPPTIMVTGHGNEAIAVEAMKLGADDYIMKDSLCGYFDLLPHRIEKTLAARRLREEKRRAEKALQDQLDLFAAVFETSPYIMMVVNQDVQVENINRTGVAFGNKPREELLGLLGGQIFRCINSFNGPGCGRNEECNRCPLHATVMRTFQTRGPTYDAEGSLTILMNSREVTLDLLISTALVKVQDTDKVLVTIADITARKKAEAALRESDKKFRMLYERAPLGYQSLDEQGCFIEVNQAWLDTLGYTRDEVIGKWCGDFLADGYQEHFRVNFPRFKAAGEIHGVEFQMVRKDGSLITVSVDGRIGRDEQGEFKQTHCILHDITERRQYEEALKASEERYRRIVETANEGICAMDSQFRTTFVNQRMADMLGYSVEEMIGRPIDLFIAEEDLSDHDEKMNERRLGRPGVFERRLCRKDGGTLWTIVSATALRDGEGNFAGSFGMFTDISERKSVEEQLSATSTVLETLINAAPVSIVALDSAGNVSLWNPASEQMFGWMQDEVLGRPLPFVPEEKREQHMAFRQRWFSGESVIGVDVQRRRKDGSPINIYFSAVPMRDSQGAITGVIGVNVDVTERKRTEEDLRASEEKFSTVFKHAPLFMTLSNVEDGTCFDVNEEVCEVSGFSRSDVIGRTTVELGWISPEDRKRVMDRLQAHGSVKGMEITLHTKEKRQIHCIYNGEFVQINDRRMLLSIAQDITERKEAREQLLLNERRLAGYLESIDAMGLGVFVVDSDYRISHMNRQMKTWFGDHIGAICHESLVGAYEPCPHCRLPLVIEQGERVSYQPTTPDGRTFEVVAGPVQNPDGSFSKMELVAEITDRKRAEADRLLLAAAIEQVPDTVQITDADGKVLYVNPAFERITGFSRAEVVGQDAGLTASGAHDEEFCRHMWNTVMNGRVWSGNLVNKKKDGTLFEEEVSIAPVMDQSGRIVNCVAVKRDVTTEELLRKQLFAAQKMEAVGTLAGGIAHDFNNLLQVITGYAEMALYYIEEGQQGHSELLEIKNAARSAGELTRGLLMFSRRIESNLKPVDLNQELVSVSKILARTLPKLIDIHMDLSEPLRPVKADPVQLQQVVMNLALNARDAMPVGGILSIATRNVNLDEEYCRSHLGTRPGKYVVLTVSDTGPGMDEKTRQHIFDPFFTTKEPGKGTGLGLAIVFGIVKSHGGNIICYSEPGSGTIFKVYLPAIAGFGDGELEGAAVVPPGGTETILLVDDEDSVRKLGEAILRRFGYTVLTASNGQEGMELFARESKRIDLVILDLIMPLMGGRSCLQEIMEFAPGTKVIIASGYAANGEVEQALRDGGKTSVRKPYEAVQLLELVRKVIDED